VAQRGTGRHYGVLVRRPSLATGLALTALFVALGGPAQAARLVGSGEVKDHSLQTRDLSRHAVRALRSTPNGSINDGKLAPGAVTSGKLGAAAVTAGKLGAGAVGTISVADGALTTADIARFSGRFSIQLPAIAKGACWAGAPQGLGPERADADISQDLVAVTPDYERSRAGLAITPWVSDRTHFAITICNAGAADWAGDLVAFRYAVFRVP
jgi:hypothetical protein